MNHPGMDAEKSVEGLLQKAYNSLKASDADGARLALDEALKLDFEHHEVVYALKCLSWWQERLKRIPELREFRVSSKEEHRISSREDAYDRGGFILSQWKSFYGFLDRIGEEPGSDSCLYAVKHFVFSQALGFFGDILGDGENQHDPGLLLQVGRCYKGVGNFEEALKYLEQAARFRREDGETLSELADANALLEETRAAKALFREAFFTDPQGIEIRNMDSELILRLAGRVRQLGYTGMELLEWIPIYGALYGVFSVKRELKLAELGKLKQSIFTLENEVRGLGAHGRDQGGLLIPRLINRYLWLIDHYENARADTALIEETMLKIKLADPAVYERYRN
jgi:tetratricopeptide (TPR) repeat protein